MSFDEDPKENHCPDCNHYEQERLEQEAKIKRLGKVIWQQSECIDNIAKEMNELLDVCYEKKSIYWYENADAAYRKARKCQKEHAETIKQYRRR